MPCRHAVPCVPCRAAMPCHVRTMCCAVVQRSADQLCAGCAMLYHATAGVGRTCCAVLCVLQCRASGEPCRAVPCRAVPCRVFTGPCLAVPCRAVKCLAGRAVPAVPCPCQCGAVWCAAVLCSVVRARARGVPCRAVSSRAAMPCSAVPCCVMPPSRAAVVLSVRGRVAVPSRQPSVRTGPCRAVPCRAVPAVPCPCQRCAVHLAPILVRRGGSCAERARWTCQ